MSTTRCRRARGDSCSSAPPRTISPTRSRTVHNGESLLFPAAVGEVPRPAAAGQAAGSPSEAEVLRLIAQGRSNSEIAAELFLGVGARQDPRTQRAGQARRRKGPRTGRHHCLRERLHPLKARGRFEAAGEASGNLGTSDPRRRPGLVHRAGLRQDRAGRMAEPLGFTQAAIYYHFAAKDILVALHLRLHELASRIEQLAAEAGPSGWAAGVVQAARRHDARQPQAVTFHHATFRQPSQACTSKDTTATTRRWNSSSARSWVTQWSACHPPSTLARRNCQNRNRGVVVPAKRPDGSSRPGAADSPSPRRVAPLRGAGVDDAFHDQ